MIGTMQSLRIFSLTSRTESRGVVRRFVLTLDEKGRLLASSGLDGVAPSSLDAIVPLSQERQRFIGTVLTLVGRGGVASESSRFSMETGNGPTTYRVEFISSPESHVILASCVDIEAERLESRPSMEQMHEDVLTGLPYRHVFMKRMYELIANASYDTARESYCVVYLDIDGFKAINSILGKDKGDDLLRQAAQSIRSQRTCRFACRIGSDRFAMLLEARREEVPAIVSSVMSGIFTHGRSYTVTCSAGIAMFRSSDTPETLMDNAILAHGTIKRNYTARYAFYTEDMRRIMLKEQAIIGKMESALENREFHIYYQPQYDHATGNIVGAEALVRWIEKEGTVISPSEFIPLFEKSGFIMRIDLFIFEKVCSFLRRMQEKGVNCPPISFNVSRQDILTSDFIDRMESIRGKYDVDTALLRVEITESMVGNGPELINAFIDRLHTLGYLVEMDDFGRGYSSLNALKALNFDIIKLDMLLISGNDPKERSGPILTSVVSMARWINMPVIAEGVETVDQADYLRSLGCTCIQGYLYARPMPEADFEERLMACAPGAPILSPTPFRSSPHERFWDANSMETLIFNRYSGSAAVLSYDHRKTEIIRANDRYLQEVGMDITEEELIGCDVLAMMEGDDRGEYVAMLERALLSGEEETCETWRTATLSNGDVRRICLRATSRLINSIGTSSILYIRIRNVTSARNATQQKYFLQRCFMEASEQANIYFWEYTVATHEMRPCFRCMRDLNCPALLTNYPESAIEMGIFPEEVADRYRDWHRQLAAGVPSLEGVFPLTADRIPFLVRYTTEFDACGRPVKAYGSATLVVDAQSVDPQGHTLACQTPTE